MKHYVLHMAISKYNLTKFITNFSYEQYKNQDTPDWNLWYHQISKIYNHNIPKNILRQLQEKNNATIDNLCETDMQRLNMKIERLAIKEKKHQEWLIRRDTGNQLAAKRRASFKEQGLFLN